MFKDLKIEGFDFEKAKNFNELKAGFVFKIKKVSLYDTQFGAMAIVIDDQDNHYYTYAEVIVNAIRKSINTGMRLVNRIAVLRRNESTAFDSETGELYEYLTLEQASGEEINQWRIDRAEANKKAKEEFEANKDKVDPAKPQKQDKPKKEKE